MLRHGSIEKIVGKKISAAGTQTAGRRGGRTWPNCLRFCSVKFCRLSTLGSGAVYPHVEALMPTLRLCSLLVGDMQDGWTAGLASVFGWPVPSLVHCISRLCWAAYSQKAACKQDHAYLPKRWYQTPRDVARVVRK